jgi:MFS family permease
VAALFFVNGTTVGSWVPHIPDRAHSLGLNSAQLGATLLAGGVGCLIAMPLSGTLTGRFGSRQVTSVAGPLFPAFLALAVLAPTAHLMAAALLLVGMAGASMDVAMNAHGVLVEQQLGRRTISLFHGLFSVGCVAGSAATSTALAHHVPARTIVLTIAVLLAGVVLAARSVLLDDSRPEPGGAAGAVGSVESIEPGPGLDQFALPSPSRLERLRALVPHGRLLLLGVLTFSAMVSEGAVADWSALLLRVTRGLGDGVVGYGFTCFSATMVLGRFTGDRVVARTGEVGALRIGGLLGVLGFGLMLGSRPLPWMLAGFALAGLGLSNSSPILYRAAGRLPGFAPGAAIAVAVGIGYAGLLAGPPWLGFLAHVTGLRSIFFVVMSLCAVIGVAAPLVRGASQAADALLPGDPISAEPVV